MVTNEGLVDLLARSLDEESNRQAVLYSQRYNAQDLRQASIHEAISLALHNVSEALKASVLV